MSVFIWMFIILKIPIGLALWLIWYAAKEPEPVTDDGSDNDGGSDRDPHRSPKVPTPPRRGGPHGAPLPGAPDRIRVSARGSRVKR